MQLQAYARDAYSSIKEGGQERSTRKADAKHGKSSSRQRKGLSK